MTKNNLYHGAWKLRAAGVLIVALALATFPLAFSHAVKAQTPVKAAAQTPAKTTASPATKSKGGPKEGIKVHGYWTIDVRNPDGALVTHRGFENSLSADGSGILATVMARLNTFGAWAIALRSSTDVSVPNLIIQEPGSLFVVPFFVGTTHNFTTLTTGVHGFKFELSGNAIASSGGTYNLVETLNSFCPSGSTSPLCASNPAGGDRLSFTGFTLGPSTSSTPVTVASGQIIQVTVAITFS